MVKFKAFSYNCNGLNDAMKRRQVFRFLKHKKADVILIQESHSTKALENIWKSEWGGPVYFSHGASNSKGVCILFKKNFEFTVHSEFKDDEGRVLCLDITIDDLRLSLCNIYAPNEDNPEFFKNAFTLLENIENSTKIIGGDFNLVMDIKLDKKGGAPSTNFNARDIVATYIEEAEIIDIWRHMHPDDFKFTWKRTKPTPIFCRLDMFFISQDILGNIDQADIIPSFKSDHSIVQIEFNSEIQERGRGFWKFNTSLLHDKDFVDGMNETIQNSINSYAHENDDFQMELLKYEVTRYSMEFSKRRARSKRNILDVLDKKIQRLHGSLHKESDQYKIDKINRDLEMTNNERETIISEKTKGSMFRCKTRWYEYGEKSSKYFFNLEKFNFNKKIMKSTYLSDGTLTRDPNKILKAQNEFYRKLYTSDENVKFNMKNTTGTKISDIDKMTLEMDFTIEELSKALKTMPNNKSPGCDGLPTEFYKFFWSKIKHVVFNAMKFAYEKGELHISARRGVITLIPKKSKDVNLLKNWRPLTLLNCDYKIVAKLLALRLKDKLLKLIHSDQTGFLKNRFIGENIRKILDLIEYTEEEDIPALLISIDFEKCFDRVEWQAVIGALKYFNFGEKFTKWISLLYENIESCTTNNGFSSHWFKPTRGLRQGCPLSPYLFLVTAEILGILIRENKNIKGIKVNNIEYKLTQYADDTNLFSLYDANSLNSIIHTFDEIQKHTGLKINYDKTSIYRIGSIRHSNAKLYTIKPFKWESDPINLLGVDITHDFNDLVFRNYNQVFKKLDNIAKLWGNRNLSLCGKIITANVLMSSQFVYKLACLTSPTELQYNRYKKSIRHYIWNGKNPKISYNTLISSIPDGGMKLVDLEHKNNALKIQWIKRIKDNISLANLAYYFLPKIGELIWKCNLHYNDVKSIMPKENFWQNVLIAWCKFNFSKKLELNSILNSIIWLNSEIQINKTPILYKRCFKKGVVFIKDIVDYRTGEFLTFEALNTKYGKTITFVEYHGILSAIPQSMKQVLQQNQQNNNLPVHNYDVFVMKNWDTRFFYTKSIENKNIIPILAEKWQDLLQTAIDDEIICKVLQNIKFITLSTKLRSFLYRLVHFAILTNTKLSEWKIVNSELCTFCNTEPETYIHLFWECPVAKQLWSQIETYCKNKANRNIIATPKKVLLCRLSTNTLDCINTICLVTLQYIYGSRCLRKIPSFAQLKLKILDEQNVEKYIATKNDKLGKHTKKWQGF